ALLLEIFGDEWMLAPAMRWRWRYDADWVCADLGRVLAPDAPPETRRALGAERLAPFRAAAAALGITEETGPEIERATLALLERLDAVLARSPYLLGARPSIGDFGMIGPLYAHLGRDPTPKALIAERAPNVAAWTARMMRPAEAGETPGAFAAADAVSAPLTRALAEMTALQAPLLREAEAATAAWLAGAAPGAEAPRAAGRGVFRIGGAEAPVALRPYSLWMLQRARDAYAALAPAARAAADGFLDQIGAGELLRERPERRLALTDFRLRAA
ncbi:MAG: glutathione S-transferase C-terminal domain-containing protein, partial [Pseudomonadota bacterium]